jgi:glycosyltransferase involved in cell wall biosynthesis
MKDKGSRIAGPIVHLVPALFDSEDGIVGGAERYVFELARHMAAVTPTRLVTFGQRAREEQIGELQIRVIADPWFVRGQRSNPVSPVVLAEVSRASVVHCHQQHVVASSLAAGAARLLGRRVFCTELGGGGWDISAYVSTDRWYHGHLHISEYSRKVSGHQSVARARVVFGGVDAVRFSPAADSTPGRTVLFVGRMLPHKGINDLVDAIDHDMTAEIIGPAPHAAYFDELQERAAGKQIQFRSDCDDAALLDAYRRAACIVLPSVYRDMYNNETLVPELLGQTLLEGMACGVAAVCTDVASLPEVVAHGETGLVVPPNDPLALRVAIRWMLDHPVERGRMGEQGRKRVLERFNWDTVVNRCIEAYAA